MLTIQELLRIYVPKDSISIVDDPLLESSRPSLVANTPTPYVVPRDIVNNIHIYKKELVMFRKP